MSIKSVIGILLIISGIAAFTGTFFYTPYAYNNIVKTQTNWPTVQGHVSSISEFYEDDDGYLLVNVEFKYTIDGIYYTGKQELMVESAGILYSQDDKDRVSLKYAVDNIVPVYYNPQNHMKAVINPILIAAGDIPIVYYLLFCGGLAIFFLGIFLLAFSRQKKTVVPNSQ